MFDSKDVLTGLKPGEPTINSQYVDWLTGEPVGSDWVEDDESLREVRKSNGSSKQAPVYTFYINGINTTRQEYRDTLPLINNLLKEAGIDSEVKQETYNKSGKFDIKQAIRQGLSSTSDREGRRFTRSVVNQIRAINKRKREDAQNECGESPKPKFLIIAHSQGNFFAEDVFNDLPPDIKKRTRILAISPFTNFRGINFNKFEYLLREDDFPTQLKKSPGIAIPRNRSNLPGWPGSPKASKTVGDRNSHNIENYLNKEKHPEGSRKDKLVERSSGRAEQYIRELLDFDSGTYKPSPCPDEASIDVTVKGRPRLRPDDTTTMQIDFNAPDGNARYLYINPLDNVWGGSTIQLPEEYAYGGTYNFDLTHANFSVAGVGECGNKKREVQVSVHDNSPLSIWGSNTIATTRPDDGVNFRLISEPDTNCLLVPDS